MVVVMGALDGRTGGQKIRWMVARQAAKHSRACQRRQLQFLMLFLMSSERRLGLFLISEDILATFFKKL
jgi:hypothetical protein